MTISSVDPLKIGDQIDRILDWYRGRRSLDGVICWYLHAGPPGELDARLFARGFAPNWHPHWMWCDLRHLHTNFRRLSTFDIHSVNHHQVVRRLLILPFAVNNPRQQPGWSNTGYLWIFFRPGISGGKSRFQRLSEK